MLKAKLLEDLIDKLHFAKGDLPSLGDKASKGDGSIKITIEQGDDDDEGEDQPQQMLSGDAVDAEMMRGKPEDATDLDAAEHDHEADAPCGPECPVKMAVLKKMGKE